MDNYKNKKTISIHQLIAQDENNTNNNSLTKECQTCPCISELATQIYIMKSGLFCISWLHFVCFSWTLHAFESLCKQSSRAATRVTRKMRALRTIESCSTLSRNAILSLLLDEKKRKDRLFAHPSTGRVP